MQRSRNWVLLCLCAAQVAFTFGCSSDGGSGGTGGGTAGLVIYFFGDHGAGSAQANIERCVGQFENPDGTPVTSAKPVVRKLGGFTVTQVEVAGTCVGGMGSGAPGGKSAQRMIASIVETDKGPYYFKFLGDDALVTESKPALDALLGSVQPSGS